MEIKVTEHKKIFLKVSKGQFIQSLTDKAGHLKKSYQKKKLMTAKDKAYYKASSWQRQNTQYHSL